MTTYDDTASLRADITALGVDITRHRETLRSNLTTLNAIRTHRRSPLHRLAQRARWALRKDSSK